MKFREVLVINIFDENKLSFIEFPEMLKKRMRPACSVVQYDDGDDMNGTVIMVVGGSSNFDDSTYSTTEIIQVDNLLEWKFGPKFDIDSGWGNGGYATYTEVMERNLFVLISGIGKDHIRHEYMYWYNEEKREFSRLPKPLSYPREFPSIAVITSGEIDCMDSNESKSLL